MPRLITLSRAARLVGVKRGTLQKRIRDGELKTFEGEIVLSDLLHAYPQTQLEDSSMLERVEQIMEQAVTKIIRDQTSPPDVKTLTARIMSLSDELARARTRTSQLEVLLNKARQKVAELQNTGDDELRNRTRELGEWFAGARQSRDTDIPEQLLAKEAFLRVMEAQIRILPCNQEFLVEGADNILEAGLRAGLALDYGCSNGQCGRCKARVVSGEVRRTQNHEYVFSEAEKGLGYILMCSNTAVTDVVLEADVAGNASDIMKQTIDVRLKKIEYPSEHLAILNVRTPRTRRLRFLAGQRVIVELVGGQRRELPIASCPCDGMNIQFHIPHNTGDPFSDCVFNELKPSETIMIKGPQGTFTLQEDTARSIVFIAFDTGFAPVKSLIEHAMALDNAEDIYLNRFFTDACPRYMDNLCRSWSDALDNFHSDSMQAPDETTVREQLNEIAGRLGRLGDFDFYVAGQEPWVTLTDDFLRRNGLPGKQLSLEILPYPGT